MKLAEINSLSELDRAEVVAKAIEVGVKVSPDVVDKSFPTTDALRIAIIETVVDQELRERSDQSTANQLGADHMAEAVLTHAHGVELHRRGLALLESEALPQRMQGEHMMKEADAHFAAARSAAAIAQAGFTLYAAAGLEDRLSEINDAVRS